MLFTAAIVSHEWYRARLRATAAAEGDRVQRAAGRISRNCDRRLPTPSTQRANVAQRFPGVESFSSDTADERGARRSDPTHAEHAATERVHAMGEVEPTEGEGRHAHG